MKRVKGFLVVALGTLAFAATPAIASVGEAALGGYYTNIAVTCAGVCGTATLDDGTVVDAASVGDTVTSTATFTNTTSKPTKGTIVVTISSAAGVLYAYSQQVNVAPGKTWSKSTSYVVSETDALGLYTATTSIGGISASASILVH